MTCPFLVKTSDSQGISDAHQEMSDDDAIAYITVHEVRGERGHRTQVLPWGRWCSTWARSGNLR